MTPILHRLLVLLLVLVSAGALGACGGGDKSEEDVETLLDRAFRQSVKSADIKLDAELQVRGVEGFDKPVRVEASGVYIAGEKSLPKVDIDLRVGSQEAGQTVESGFLSTGDRAFLKFGGEFYEQPQEDIARANRELAGADSSGTGGLSELGLDPRRWVVEGTSEGEGEVGGVATEHVSARLDVRAAFADLNKLVERSAGAIGGVTPGTPEPLTSEQLDTVSEVVEDPTFDVHVGKDDDVIRRLSANIEIVVPEAQRAAVGGIEGGTLRVSLELSKVNGDQEVEAPADPRPIGELTTQLEGLGGLGAPGAPTPEEPPEPGATTPEQGAPGPDVLEEYADCLDQAAPDDAAALERCRDLLP